MKKIILVISLLGLGFIGNAQDFRNVSFGFSMAEVKKQEKGLAIEQETTEALCFSSKLNGIPVTVFYYFIENKLVRGGYILDYRPRNPQEYINVYLKLYESLNSLYGEPILLNEFLDPEASFNTWGMAMVKGEAIFKNMWKTKTSQIILFLEGSNYQVDQFTLIYESLKDLDLIEKTANKRNTEGL